jgi:hypothetical protein
MPAIPLVIYQLVEARIALKFEIKHGHGPTRAVNSKSIIPWLYKYYITEVCQARYSQEHKIKAYNDLNKYMTDHGMDDRPL